MGRSTTLCAAAVAAIAAIAADQWISGLLTGWTLRLWIWTSNGVVFIALGVLVRKLLRDRRSAEEGWIHSTREAVGLYSLRGTRIDMNVELERLTGYGPDEALGETYLSWLAEEHRGQAEEAFRRCGSGLPQHFEAVCYRKDGEALDVEISYVLALTGSRVASVYGFVKDVTEMKRHRELLLQSEKLAVVGELAAGIAHEIRNPLTSLRGFVQLSQRQSPSRYTEIMLTELDRIHTIASELLFLGKPQTMVCEDKTVGDLLASIITLVNTQAIMQNVEIAYEPDDLAMNAKVRCEETKMKQVFLNVLKNAVESMPQGGKVRVRLDRVHSDVRVLISDQGVGIAREEIERIGQAFYTTKENGTGLGLMVSFNILEQHGGRMTIESEEEAGTTVDIRLPEAR